MDKSKTFRQKMTKEVQVIFHATTANLPCRLNWHFSSSSSSSSTFFFFVVFFFFIFIFFIFIIIIIIIIFFFFISSLSSSSSYFSSSSSTGTTSHCGLWLVEQCPSIFFCHQISPSSHSQHLKISFYFLFPFLPFPSPRSFQF